VLIIAGDEDIIRKIGLEMYENIPKAIMYNATINTFRASIESKYLMKSLIDFIRTIYKTRFRLYKVVK
jgi:hypothetical protein